MTERIDHAAEAMNFLGATVIDTHGDDDRKVAIAQVHATLALAEQQRFANIIAALELVATGVDAKRHNVADYDELHSELMPDVIAGLGL